MMRKLNDETEASHVFYSGEFEIFPGTDFDDVIGEMFQWTSEKFEKMETRSLPLHRSSTLFL